MTLVDALLAASWLALVADGARQRHGERAARANLGPPVAGRRPPSLVLRAVILAVPLAAGVALERAVGRLPGHPALEIMGLALVAAGLALHHLARRRLGRHWEPIITVRADQPIVADGPYGVIRHPLYAAVLVMASGTLLAHPSLATASASAGLLAGTLLKIRAEEAALARVLGERWHRYAAQVPAIVPRLTGRR